MVICWINVSSLFCINLDFKYISGINTYVIISVMRHAWRTTNLEMTGRS
jgi:hypothetical protein